MDREPDDEAAAAAVASWLSVGSSGGTSAASPARLRLPLMTDTVADRSEKEAEEREGGKTIRLNLKNRKTEKSATAERDA